MAELHPEGGPAASLVFPFQKILLAALLVGMTVAQCSSQTVSPRFFGMHVNRVEHWPALAFGAVRGANVSWRAINPARGYYNWHELDRFVGMAQEEGVQYSYVFLATPQWAASDPKQPCYAGPVGCASPPANLTDWDTFVKAVVQRYRGRIQSYEVWNEPNDPHFWTGSVEQMLAMAQHAYRIIHSTDPSAQVISPSPTSSRLGPPQKWLEEFLKAGGGDYADIIGFHGYTGSPRAEGIVPVVEQIKQVMTEHGQSSKELWDTEGGWGQDNVLSDNDARSAFLAKSYILQASLGVSRFFWYQWDNPNWGTLWQGRDEPAAQAYARVRQWLAGASITAPCSEKAGIWSCVLARAGRTQKLVWSSGGNIRISVEPKFASYSGLSGEASRLTSAPLTVGPGPLLLQERN